MNDETAAVTRPRLERRVGGLAGLAFVLGVVLQNAVLLAGMPAPDAAVDQVRAFYVDHHGRIGLAVGIVALNVVFLLVFAAVAATALGEDRRGEGPARVLVPAGALLAGAFLMTTALQAVLVARAETLGDDVLLALWDLHTTAFAMSASGLALVLLALGVGALGTSRVLPRWSAALALVGAACLVVAGLLAADSPDGGPGLVLQLVGFGLWLVTLVTASVGLLRRH